MSRGAGTSLGGQSTNDAVVIDMSTRLRAVNWVDPERRLASVQPGCVLDDLREATRSHGLTFGPDPATHNRCTLGGMIGNNACGVHAQMAGRTADNVEEMEVLLYDGTRMRVGPTSEDDLDRIVAAGDRQAEVYGRLRELRDRYGDLIRERFPDIPRRVSGFTLEKLLPEHGSNVAQALVGSEGTCVAILEAVVKLVPEPRVRTLVVLGYEDEFDAADAVPGIVEHSPIALEGIDRVLIDHLHRKHLHEGDLPLLPDGEGWLIVEFGGDSREESDAAAHRLVDAVGEGKWPKAVMYASPEEEEKLWEVRESGLGATARVPGEPDSHPGWEDSAVPPERLGDYLRDLRALFDELGYSASLYGHFGQGCVHCRIDFDLATAHGVANFRRFMDRASDLVVSYGGSLSGEHGDGQARAELLEKMYGPGLVEAFREFKSIWDPGWKVNPGKVVDPRPMTADLRLGPEYSPTHDRTHFSFPRDRGAMARAAERCVGVGKCLRDDGHGTMCPSYMVTHDERHSTRGRAHLLFEMMRGEVITDGWRSEEVKDALDLCLSCKGCKSDCPVDVDLATYKAEFLAHHFRGRLRPVQAYSIGLIHWWSRLASRTPRLVNLLGRLPPTAGVIRALGGVAQEREIPRFATETLREWISTRTPSVEDGPEVLLFPDTFSNHLDPAPGKATVEVLEAAGYRVRIPPKVLCCGRPLYDYGMLPTARRLLRRMIDVLRDEIRRGVPLVGIEPSCIAVLRDELPEMLPDDRDGLRLSEQTYTLAEFLVERAPPDFEPPPMGGREAIIQKHCHHDAVMHLHDDLELFRRMDLDVRDLDAGFCGLAGSFGFEAGEKYQVSVAAGERKMAPAVRDAGEETILLADGFSCRTQIRHLTGRRARHLAEVVAEGLHRSPEPSADGSGRPALLVAGAAGVAGAAALLARRLLRGR